MGRVRETGQNEREGNEGQKVQIVYEGQQCLKRENIQRKSQKNKWKGNITTKKVTFNQC